MRRLVLQIEPIERVPVVLPLPVSEPAYADQQNQSEHHPRITARRLILIQVVKFRLRILRQSQERRPVHSFCAVSIPRRRNAASAFSPQGFFGCSGYRSRRVRKRSSAHPAESVLRAIVISAMGAADVHGFKHISIFGWQKGCCCWPKLKGRGSRLVSVPA